MSDNVETFNDVFGDRKFSGQMNKNVINKETKRKKRKIFFLKGKNFF